MTTNHDDAAHSGRNVYRAFASVFLPIAAVAGVVFYLVSADRFQPDYQPVEVSSQAKDAAVSERIQKVGGFAVQQADRPLESGEAVFQAQCAACHATGAAGAPKFKDAGAWAPRLGQGLEKLTQSALKGKNAMGAQGGGRYNDIEITRAVVYLANAGGAKFVEPKVQAAAPASAASASK